MNRRDLMRKLEHQGLIPKQVMRKHHNAPEAGFDSKLEHRVYQRLCLAHGERNVIRQVSIPLGKLRIRPDFMVIEERFGDGSFRARLVDAKGLPTREWRAKANHLEQAHGLEIQIIRAEDL